MIELKNVTRTYTSGGKSIDAVADVSLSIMDGEFVAVVGHSGSGKTTLVSLMGGLTRPTAGSVLIGGRDIWSLDNKGLAALRSAEIGFCFQFSSLIQTLNCIDNVRLPASFTSNSHESNREAQRLLELMGVADKARAYPAELSGGQQRRVAIARSLINKPRIILADEPTGDLDEDTESDVMDLFQEINVGGVTIVMVTHSSNLAGRAGRTLKMENGSIVAKVREASV